MIGSEAGGGGAAEDVAGALEVGVQHLIGPARVGGNHCRAVDDGITAVEGPCGALRVGDVSENVIADVHADRLGAGRQSARIADEEACLMARVLYRLGGPCADESRGAGDQYSHLSSDSDATRPDALYPFSRPAIDQPVTCWIWIRLPHVSSNTAVVTGPISVGGWVSAGPCPGRRRTRWTGGFSCRFLPVEGPPPQDLAEWSPCRCSGTCTCPRGGSRADRRLRARRDAARSPGGRTPARAAWSGGCRSRTGSVRRVRSVHRGLRGAWDRPGP